MTNNPAQIKALAVKAALASDWKAAIDYNQQLLEISPNDIASLNRLGFAQLRSGDSTSAKTTYEKVLEIDKFNPIAQKTLNRMGKIKTHSNGAKKLNVGKVQTSFIEEPGRTKSVHLIRPCESKTMLDLAIGMEVKLIAKKRRVCVETLENEYVGTLPDDVGMRLDKLLKAGYKYETFIKTIEDKDVSVFIREVYRSNQAKNMPSFTNNYSSSGSFSGTNIATSIESIPIDVTPTGEDEAIDT